MKKVLISLKGFIRQQAKKCSSSFLLIEKENCSA